MTQKLKIAAAGLGRMGKRHAINFLHRTPRAELVAAFSPDPSELAWGKENLEPYGVTLYDDYKKMIEHEGLMAVVIGTATSVHAEEAIQAMEKNLHVLCEKPLSTSIDVVSNPRDLDEWLRAYVCTPPEAAANLVSHLKSANKSSPRLASGHTSRSCAASPGASTSPTATPTPRWSRG